jgi:hypothetical protein
VDPAIVLKVGPSPEHSSEAKSGRYKTVEWWKDRLEVAAIVAGIFYAIVTFCMWRDAHDNFVVNQRAWVGVDRPIDLESLKDGSLEYIVTIKNFGNSVGTDVGISAEAISAWDKMKPVSEDTCHNATNTSHFSKVRVRTNFGEMPKGISAGVIFPNDVAGHHFSSGVQKGIAESPLTVVGCIIYRDQFDKERRTRFCYQAVTGEDTFPRLIYPCVVGVNDAS